MVLSLVLMANIIPKDISSGQMANTIRPDLFWALMVDIIEKVNSWEWTEDTILKVSLSGKMAHSIQQVHS